MDGNGAAGKEGSARFPRPSKEFHSLTSVQITYFFQQFYLHPSPGCQTEGVEVRDGGTAHARLIGVYCGDRPSTVKSAGNVLYVRYYSNADSPNIGFRAKFKIGKRKARIHSYEFFSNIV